MIEKREKERGEGEEKWRVNGDYPLFGLREKGKQEKW